MKTFEKQASSAEAASSQTSPPRRNLPPGPRSYLPGGQLLAFRKRPLEYLQNITATYGDVAYFKLGGQSIFVVNHPDLIKEVLVTNQQRLGIGTTLRRAKSFFGEGLLTSEGERHRRQRKITQPAFHSERIANYGTIMTQCAADLSDKWRAGQAIDVADEMKRLTLRIAGQTFFSVDVEAEAGEVVEALTLLMEKASATYRPRLPFARLVNKALRRRTTADSGRERIDQVIYRIIAERRKESIVSQNDLLAMLMNTPSDEEEVGAMSDRQLRDELVTLFMAGHETTANALTWAWYLLSQFPDVEMKLRAELKDMRADGGPGLNTMQNFPYLQMFVKEVLRFYPPVWLLSRTVLEEVSVSGYRIPAGALILLSPYVIHRDLRFFPEPQRFDPERWAADKTEKPHPFSYFPFGGGPRRCIGEGFAWLEIALVIATLLPRWRMSLAPRQKVEVQPLITLRAKRGIHMRLAAVE